MRKWTMAFAVVAALAVAAGALSAADLDNGSGQSCGDSIGSWHFVNNQTDGAAAGSLTACFTSGCQTVGASAVNKNTQHFDVEASGTLLSASSTLGGKLVLSDFSCGEPPKCDPKTEICK